ncbi:DUF1036 domain-containing protein [Devosia sp.]|uniref:DUF1036 domain-containing protein n=1 Tax=Devosia sp. TaxID=1871048 RepID=UPI0035B3A706
MAIAGLLAAAFVALAVWFLVPRAEISSGTAQAQDVSPAPEAPAEIAAENGGTGDFRVCNETSNRVSVAFGYRADKGWQSEGWWVAEPGVCVTVYRGDLGTRRYYYLYAADDIGGGAWDGNVYMCTRDESFTIFGVEDCLARGYERTGFFEVDTQNKSNWTLQLTEGEVVGGDAEGTEETLPLEGDLPGEADDAGQTDDTPTDEGAPLQ